MRQLVENYVRYLAETDNLQQNLKLTEAQLKSAEQRLSTALSNLLHEARTNPAKNDRRFFQTNAGILEVTSTGVKLIPLE